MQGCGGDCACAQTANEKENCELPVGGVVLDKDGKCPCGKSKEDCCHSESLEDDSALHELCEPHNGKHVCDVETEIKSGV